LIRLTLQHTRASLQTDNEMIDFSSTLTIFMYCENALNAI